MVLGAPKATILVIHDCLPLIWGDNERSLFELEKPLFEKGVYELLILEFILQRKLLSS